MKVRCGGMRLYKLYSIMVFEGQALTVKVFLTVILNASKVVYRRALLGFTTEKYQNFSYLFIYLFIYLFS